MSSPERPPPYSTDDRQLELDSEIEVFTAGGPGGQHRNKTQTGVRLYHRPSGVRVSATERRSLEANRRAAWERLKRRLELLNQPKRPRKPTRPSLGAKKRRLEQKERAARKKSARRPIIDND